MKTYVRILAGIGCALLLTVPLARSAAAVCPGDQDCDGIPDGVDNCPLAPNAGQENADGDSLGDVCDKCTLDSRGAVTNCDSDQDGYGNPCDGDFNQTNTVNSIDYTMFFVPGFGTQADPQSRGYDMNCNGLFEGAFSGPNSVDYLEYFLPQQQSGVPGPSGLACAGTIPCN